MGWNEGDLENEIEPAAEGTGCRKKETPAAVCRTDGQIALRQQVIEVSHSLELAAQNIRRGERLQENQVEVRVRLAQSTIIRIGEGDRVGGNPTVGCDDVGLKQRDGGAQFEGK